MVKPDVISCEELERCSDYAEDKDVRQTRIRVKYGETSIVKGLKGGLLVQITGDVWPWPCISA